MTLVHALVFVLAPQAVLPGDGTEWSELIEAQRMGIGSGVWLRMFRVPPQTTLSLDDLVASGLADADGSDPFRSFDQDSSDPGPARRNLICDAVVPHIDCKSLWLGAYELSGNPNDTKQGCPDQRMTIERISCLDQFPLREAENETCWFYPTDNGNYLCWESQQRLVLSPGYLADKSVQSDRLEYKRSDICVLWSLMADDQSLTCVGLTHQRRRIEWPMSTSSAEPFATWTSFQVDTMADETYQEQSNITVFPQPR